MKKQTAYINGKTVKFEFGEKVYSIPGIPDNEDILIWVDVEGAGFPKLNDVAYQCFNHEDEEPNFEGFEYVAVYVLNNFYAVESIGGTFTGAIKFNINSITKAYNLDQL